MGLTRPALARWARARPVPKTGCAKIVVISSGFSSVVLSARLVETGVLVLRWPPIGRTKR